MVDVMLAELREQFLSYLKTTFGDEFPRLLDEPAGLQIGERVMYRLASGKTGTRHEPSEQEIENLRRRMIDVAKDTGVEDSAITYEPPRSSGLPYPRLIDLPGSNIIWDAELRKYAGSDDLLPAPGFPLEWAVGVLLTSEVLFLYLNLTHQKVKAVFTGSYDPEHDFGGRTRVGEQFRRFRQKEDELRARVAADSTIAWARIVQMEMDPASVRINSGAKILQVDTEPALVRREAGDEARPKRWWKFW